MAAVVAYFDASGSPGDSSVVSLAGLVTTAEKWVAFSDEWQECLDVFGVSALHMKDFAHSKREFSSWWLNEPKRRRFLSALLETVENHIEYTVAAAVWIKDYNDADERYCLSEFMRPYTIGASTCVAGIIDWATEPPRGAGAIAYIFEKGDSDQNDVNRCWRALFPERSLSPISLKKIDKLPSSEICAPIRPFEAADFIAYESLRANKALVESGGSMFFDELRAPMQRMRKLPGAEQWRLFNLKDLEATCEAYGIQKRA